MTKSNFTKNKSPFMEILDRECKRVIKGRFKTVDVIRVAQRTYNEQQEIIKALRQHMNSMAKQ